MKNGKFVEKMSAIAYKINSYKYIIAIKNAFTNLLPIIITGAFATLFSNMVFDSTNGLAQFGPLSFLEIFKPVSQSINYATMNLMALAAVFLIGLEMAKLNKLGSTGFAGLLAVISYIAVIPTTINVLIGEEMAEVGNVISSDYTGSRGLFLGMAVAILSVELFTWLSNKESLKIHMPDSVPSNVARSFSALIPTVLTVTLLATLSYVILWVSGQHVYEIIYTVVQGPLEELVSGLPGILLLMFVAQVFWVIGIHGNQMIKPIREPILLAAIAQNTAAFEAGEEIPNIISMPFWDIYMSMGGSGVTIGMLIAIFIVSRRKDFRAIAKLSVAPGLFNINEPIIFGIPVMLNPIMAIPFILTPLITGTIGYFATVIGFAGPAVVMIPWTTPPLLSGYLATAGSLGAVATQLICIVAATLIYLPFVKASGVEKSVEASVEVAEQKA
ncbi:PTS sugar transporter subunit IIC [Lacticigenium naphthae]|uniref:PTS sugar transporter subunit IIC n=1 Tax=Lacticigenium naphthae TaxID=515351 RepID=UPI000415DC0A|nr:PTS transporter subunit EIIC [Lacticigenium naphthae]